MFYINDDMSIYITRGDSATFTVGANNNGVAYMFQPGDVIRFKVTEKKNCANVVLHKEFAVEEETDTVTIVLDRHDTKIGEVISKPVDYWYEVELNPFTEPQTIIGYDEDGAKIFKLFPEGSDVVPDIDEEDISLIDDTLSLTSERPIQNQAVSRAIFGIIRAIETDGDIPAEEYYGMKGATGDEDGSGGMVPAPKKGEQDFVLYGDGTWREAEGGGGSGIGEETDPTVPSWAKQPTKPTYTAEEVGALPASTEIPKKLSDLSDDSTHRLVTDSEKSAWNAKANTSDIPSKVSQLSNDSGYLTSAHNTSNAAHSDIRLLISGFSERLNALANSTDEDLDQLAEIVSYIKNNKSLIDGITTSKVNVSDIIDNLTTSVSNKPLSAKQGVALKALIDEIVIPTTLPASDVYSWAKQPSKPTYTAGEVGAVASSELSSAVNTALAQAKASGEFDGEDGQDGQPGVDGQDGTSVTVKSVSESSADGGSNVVTFSDGKTLTVKNGSKGSKGDPGENYTLTEADKAEIIDAVPAEIYVGEGEMPDDAVVQFIMDGENEEQALKDELKEYIDEELADFAAQVNAKLPINQGAANVGKILVVGTDGNLTLTDMPEGGASGDVIGTLDESNNILLTGNLADGTYTLKYENADGTYTEIGILEVGKIEPVKTNFFVVGGDGYLNPGRASSSGADRTDVTTCLLSNYIEVQNGDIVCVDGMVINGNLASNSGFYNTSKTGVYGGKIESATSYVKDTSFTDNGGQFTINNANVGFIRICGAIPSDLNAVKVTIQRNGEWL